MTWNKKNDQFAISRRFRQSSERLNRWINRRAKPNETCEIEIDLRVFNQFIATERERPYDRKTIKEALRQLDEKSEGLITITKSYTWAIHKILVRPLATVKEINSQIGDKLPKLTTGQSMFDAEYKKQARELLLQNISKLDSLFKKLGMFYNHESLMRIWIAAGKKMSEVKGAVEYMLKVHADKIQRAKEIGVDSLEELQEKGITTPRGWLIRCLEGFWHHKQEEAFLPCLEGDYIYTFVDSLMKLDTSQIA